MHAASTPTWRRSSFCANAGCVEVAWSNQSVAVRDAKTEAGPILVYSKEEWRAFIAGVKAGEFDEYAADR